MQTTMTDDMYLSGDGKEDPFEVVRFYRRREQSASGTTHRLNTSGFRAFEGPTATELEVRGDQVAGSLICYSDNLRVSSLIRSESRFDEEHSE